ncbi:MAG: lipoate--protein ligase family protein [bacterium]|nr:lipoate--protein ligase family protein [bacterium]
MGKSCFLTDSCDNAKLNMQYDENLLLKAKSDRAVLRYFRFYRWPLKSITYSYKQDLPNDLMVFDNSRRITGGGIVFHCPGDIVFSATGKMNDDFFPDTLKKKILFITGTLRNILIKNGVKAGWRQGDNKKNRSDINFCATYYSPYELYAGDQKICGITMRNTRETFIIQGIIHMSSSYDEFKEIENKYRAFFTKGIENNKTNDLLKAIEKVFLSS